MLPSDAKARKDIPIFSGCVAYFPHALAALAQLSKIANEQHNPGEPLHWVKEKSSDELDALMRHVTDMAIDKTHRDPDGVLAAVKAFWRAGANLERMHDAGINIFAEDAQAQPGQLVTYGVRTSHIDPLTFRTREEHFGPFKTREEAELFKRLNQPLGDITRITTPLNERNCKQ